MTKNSNFICLYTLVYLLRDEFGSILSFDIHWKYVWLSFGGFILSYNL